MNYSLRDQYQSYHNNLFGIIETAIVHKYDSIDFGQTAEIPKTRLGGNLSERRMFAYHKNQVIYFFLRLFKGFFSYRKSNENYHVFKIEV
jgi:hypothetical protein